MAFKSAAKNGNKRITCCHKANIMKLTDGLFLETFYEVAKKYPAIKADDIIVDDLAMKLVSRPDKFDTIVLPNLQGDIMSDLAAGLVGGLGLAPSANIGDDICIFEAVHGTAPDLVGKGVANPTALFLSSLMMLRHLGLGEKADYLLQALKKTLQAGIRTVDLSQRAGKSPASTEEFASGIISNLPPAATKVVVNIPSEFKPKHITKPSANELMVSKPPKVQSTVGCDIFVDTDLLPKELAAKFNGIIQGKPLKLVMISNRGTQVWPSGSLFTQCINHYRCRIESIEKENPVPEHELIDMISGISKSGLRVCSFEMLRVLDGLQKFSLAQGQ
jgi:isocitrate dehydrogenase